MLIHIPPALGIGSLIMLTKIQPHFLVLGGDSQPYRHIHDFKNEIGSDDRKGQGYQSQYDLYTELFGVSEKQTRGPDLGKQPCR